MGKSIYSLALSDEVVEAVDELAVRSGLSRSAVINRILAEKVALEIPEIKIGGIVDFVRGEMEKLFLLTAMTGAGTVSARSQLKYKYKPTVRYSVGIWAQNGEKRGELRAALRTQNAELIGVVNMFFELWSRMEEYMFLKTGSFTPDYNIAGGKYSRMLRLPADIPDETLGKAVADYAELLDKGLKVYMRALPDIALAKDEAKKYFAENYGKNSYMI